MSGKATGWVLAHGPKVRAQRAVLITIADAANADGEHAHPGMAAMVEGSLYSAGHVRRIVGDLLTEGWIEVEEGSGRAGGRGLATVYRIPGVKGAQDARVTEPETRASDPSKRAHSDPKGAHPDARPTVYTTVNHQQPPPTPPPGGTVAKRASRIPEPFIVSPEMQAWFAEEPTFAHIDWRSETAKFTDHFRGSGRAKLDWVATWRNWIRRAAEQGSTGTTITGHRPSPVERGLATLARTARALEDQENGQPPSRQHSRPDAIDVDATRAD